MPAVPDHSSLVFCPRCHREFPRNFKFCPYDGEVTTLTPSIDRVRVSPTLMTDALLGDRYKVRGFIGKGGMARVYLADDTQTGLPVAVKVLERMHAKDRKARERFLQEARTASLIGHPNIINVLEAGERQPDGAPYIVMEFLFGESIGAYVRREGTMGLDLAVPVVRQAASALAAAHAKGIVHRDVKPDNFFLIGEPGDPYDLKVLDFGMSKLQSSKLTAAGIVMGTPAYMAPEQVLGEPLDARTDVYALGTLLYRILAGRVPFDAADDIEMIAHQVWTPPPRPTLFAPGIPARLVAIILTAIRKRPADRYPTMAILFDDLGKLGDAGARLWAGPVRDDRYEPVGTVGKLTAAALGRMLGHEVEI